LLNDQSGSVLGDSTVFSWAGCHSVLPTPGGRPSLPLFSTVRQGRCQPRGTVPPTPVRLIRRALEGGPAVPSNIFYVLMQGHAVTSGRRDRSSPSLSALCGHPRPCRTTPDTVATSQRCWDVQGQDVATTATVPRTGSSSTPPSKPLLYEHKTHHDASTGAEFARTAVSSAALFAIPLHVEK
jgi:hypothetical protein